MASKFAVGTELRYCHEGEDRRAQVSDVHPEGHPNEGEVCGITVYDADGNMICGVRDPSPATAKEHRITDGFFWKQ